jgi:hypothetical protein
MNASFWFAALSPFVSAVAAFATAAALVRGPESIRAIELAQASGMFVQ